MSTTGYVNNAVTLVTNAVEWYVLAAGGGTIEPYIYNIKMKVELAS